MSSTTIVVPAEAACNSRSSNPSNLAILASGSKAWAENSPMTVERSGVEIYGGKKATAERRCSPKSFIDRSRSDAESVSVRITSARCKRNSWSRSCRFLGNILKHHDPTCYGAFGSYRRRLKSTSKAEPSLRIRTSSLFTSTFPERIASKSGHSDAGN